MCYVRALGRSAATSRGRERGLAEYKLLVLILPLAAILGSAQVVTADEYFDKALDRIEQALVRPADSYGFVVTDHWESSNLGTKVTERCTFRASSGKVYLQREKFEFDQTEANPPRSKHTFVSPGRSGQKATTVDSALGRNILTENAPVGILSIGVDERFFYRCELGTAAEDAISPDEEPFQALANPCFAPLGISPVQLRNLSVTALPNEGANRVYEAKWQEYDDWNTLRLYFSPEHGDALTKSEYEHSIPDASGEPHLYSRMVRTVEQWQVLPDGTWVPARYSVRSEFRGKLVSTLERDISSPVIGNLSDALFDTVQLAEFNVKMDTILDRAHFYGVRPTPSRRVSP